MPRQLMAPREQLKQQGPRLAELDRRMSLALGSRRNRRNHRPAPRSQYQILDWLMRARVAAGFPRSVPTSSPIPVASNIHS